MIKDFIGRMQQILGVIHTQLEASAQLKLPHAKNAFRLPLSFFERQHYLKVQRCLDSKDIVVLDIGASVGRFATAMAKSRNVSRVYAFEPLPDIYDKLAEQTQKFTSIQTFNVALGEKDDTISFHRNAYSPSSSLLPMTDLHKKEFPFTKRSSEQQVRVVRLNEFAKENNLAAPYLIKIDVQGYEDKVLNGGSDIVRQGRYCVIEISLEPLYEGSPSFNEIYLHLQELGFTFMGILDYLTGKAGNILQVDGLFERKDYSC